MDANNILKLSFNKINDTKSMNSFLHACSQYIRNHPDNFEYMYSLYELAINKDIPLDDVTLSAAFLIFETTFSSCPSSDVLNVYAKLKKQTQLLNKTEDNLHGNRYVYASRAFASAAERIPVLTDNALKNILNMKMSCPDIAHMIEISIDRFLSNRHSNLPKDKVDIMRRIENYERQAHSDIGRATPDLKTLYDPFFGAIQHVKSPHIEHINHGSDFGTDDYFFPNNLYAIRFKGNVNNDDLIYNPEHSKYIKSKFDNRDHEPTVVGYYDVEKLIRGCTSDSYKIPVEEFLLSLSKEQLETLPEKDPKDLNYFDYKDLLTQCHLDFCKNMAWHGKYYDVPKIKLDEKRIRVKTDDVDKSNGIMSSQHLTSEEVEKRLLSLSVDDYIEQKYNEMQDRDDFFFQEPEIPFDYTCISYYQLSDESKKSLIQAEPFAISYLNHALDNDEKDISYDLLAIFGPKLSKEKQQKINEKMAEVEKSCTADERKNRNNQLKRIGLEYCGMITHKQIGNTHRNVNKGISM